MSEGVEGRRGEGEVMEVRYLSLGLLVAHVGIDREAPRPRERDKQRDRGT